MSHQRSINSKVESIRSSGDKNNTLIMLINPKITKLNQGGKEAKLKLRMNRVVTTQSRDRASRNHVLIENPSSNIYVETNLHEEEQRQYTLEPVVQQDGHH